MSIDESQLRQTRCPHCRYELRPIITSGQSCCPECGRKFSLVVRPGIAVLWWILPIALLLWASIQAWLSLLFSLIEGTFDLANNRAFYGLIEAVLWPFLLALFLPAKNRLFKRAYYVRWSITAAVLAAIFGWYVWVPAS